MISAHEAIVPEFQARVLPPPMSIQQSLRDAIKARVDSGESLHAISINAQVTYTNLFRFMRTEGDLRLSTVNKLATYLGLRLYHEGQCCTDDKARKPKRT